MTAPATHKTFSVPAKHETAKQWLQRRLRKLPSIQPKSDQGDDGLRAIASLQRPRTAPSSGVATEADVDIIPPVPPIPINVQNSRHSSSIRPPIRPSRPDAGVARDINAWLDASNTPSPPLMGGVSYWRRAMDANAKNTAGIQHATPITQQLMYNGPARSHSQQAKSFRKKAKKLQVQMPLLRNKSLRQASQKKINRQSNSTPVLGVPYEATDEGTPPMLMTRRRYIRSPTKRDVSSMLSATPVTRPTSNEPLLEQPRFRYGSPSSTRTTEAEGSIDRRRNAVFARSTRSADSTRPSTAAALIRREDSMGDLSDVPTYSTGLPPPSYHSRPASILTTSSFGCIDGMSPAQRQMSQQRAALQRGMRVRLKRFAQSFTTST